MKLNNSSGNVLFLILIAVALFAALSYAVTSSNRGSGNAKPEKVKLQASAILSYTSAMRSTVQRLKLSNGCSDETLSVSNPIWKNVGGTSLNPTNPNAPLDGSCSLFNPNGGGMAPIVFDPDALNMTHPDVVSPPSNGYLRAGHTRFMVAQVKDIGLETEKDLLIVVNYLNRETCLEINNMSGVDNPGGEPPVSAPPSAAAAAYAGDLSAGSGYKDISAPTFCWNSGGGSGVPVYQYHGVIIER